MKHIHLFSLAVAALLAASCNNISYEDRLVEEMIEPVVPTMEEARNVLIEDFTGQNCPNCPTATNVVENLEHFYSGHVVAVGIHSGMLGMGTPLFTKEGQEYFLKLGNENLPQPAVRVNRIGEPLCGGPEVQNRLPELVITNVAQATPVKIDDYTGTASESDANTYDVNFNISTTLSLHALVQVWVTESDIISWQKMPDGSRNREFRHNNVFRTTLTPIDGDAVTLTKDIAMPCHYSLAVNSAWTPVNMSIVVIVSSKDGEMLQVKRFPLVSA